MRVGFVMFCVVALSQSVPADVVELAPSADSWISSCSSSCTVNNGRMDELRVRSSWWGASQSREPKNFRSLLRFDLSGLPGDADLITEATLGMYYFVAPHADPVGRRYDIHRLTNSWEEDNSTWQVRDNANSAKPDYWDSFDAGVPAYQPGGGDFAPTPCASSVVPTTTGQWMTWDVTNLVKTWVDGTWVNDGLIVRDSDEIASDPGTGSVSYLARFRSTDFHNADYRPYLDVCVVPEPATAGLLALALGGVGLLHRSRRR